MLYPVIEQLGHTAGFAAAEADARITRGKRTPEALLDEIPARTDGVKLFVEEMTEAAIESGVLRETIDGYRLDGPLSALAIPTTLHDSLMAQLHQLRPVKEAESSHSAPLCGKRRRSIDALARTRKWAPPRRLQERHQMAKRLSRPHAVQRFDRETDDVAIGILECRCGQVGGLRP